MRYILYSEAFLVGLFRSTRIVRSKDCSGLLFLRGLTWTPDSTSSLKGILMLSLRERGRKQGNGLEHVIPVLAGSWR
jgi:hypothetical protein